MKDLSENKGASSEAELLTSLLAELGQDGAFRLGMLMQIVSMMDRNRITKLEGDLRVMVKDRDEWRGLYHRNKNGVREDPDGGTV